MYIMGENPVISDPNISHAEEWVRRLEFLAVQDLFLTETARWADVILPGSSFAEKGGTVVNTDRHIQMLQPAVPPPGEARRDLDILIDLSRRLGLKTSFDTPKEVMREIASVTPSWRGVSYEKLYTHGALQYPVVDEQSTGTPFLFADEFPTADGRALFIPVEFLAPNELPNEEYPYILNTGRQMYHWHTGTMSRRSTGLDAREPVPVVEMNPQDADDLRVEEGDSVRVTSRRGSILCQARVNDEVARGELFMPFVSLQGAAANFLTNNVYDPNGMPEYKVCAVHIAPA
jgi:formate dehydrogenase major subunit